MNFINKLYFLDFFAYPICFEYQKRKSYSTLLGKIISLSFLVFLVGYLFVFINDLIEKQNPRMINNYKQNTDDKYNIIELSEYPMILTIFPNSNLNEMVDIDTMLKIKARVYNRDKVIINKLIILNYKSL